MTISAASGSPIALITGAAGGIGRALVRTFCNADYRVIASDLIARPKDLPCAHYVRADLARVVKNGAYADKVFDRIRKCLDGHNLNTLINNAAVQIVGGASSLTRDGMDHHIKCESSRAIPLYPSVPPATRSCQRERPKHQHPRPPDQKNFVAYATSKAALSGMTRALAVDLGSRVRVNAIEPAAIETEMLLAAFKGKPDLYQLLEAYHPQRRLGHPDEVARLALTLASSGLDFVHGACIGLDGGIAARLFDPE
ncbi:MAG: SDR family oxidoreductase [Candidatus Accumulibacter sp.]|nr:SDR family oxidoreductase [Accumulibacter sp.]